MHGATTTRCPTRSGAVRIAFVCAAVLSGWLLGSHPCPASATPLWLERGRPTPSAQQAAATLASAADDALRPEDYDAVALLLALTAASREPLEPAAAARLDEALTGAVARYLRDLHCGRLDPRRVYSGSVMPAPCHFDAAGYLATVLTAPRLADALRAAAPLIPLYAQLRTQLARYRMLSGHPAWSSPLPPVSAGKLEPGNAWPGLGLLVQRLSALGDLPQDAPVPRIYDEPLRQGVEAFQRRHDLAPDGVIGKATLAQLAVPPGERARQIELAMERLRWTPLLDAPRMIVVNIPEFVLRAYEVHEGSIAVQLKTRVIVGKALKTETPLLREELRYIEFSPYWNVPPSIARQELVPRLRRDPAWFDQQGFEFVARTGEVQTELSPAALDAVLLGALRIRQRPGPNNALGDIKFGLRSGDIYLHHTPTTRLFQRERRDFSHGCIRVEDPVALARFVLRHSPQWSEERIRAAMALGESATVGLREPLPVLIAYSTALVEQGQLHFFADIYGHDRRLDEALRQQFLERAPLRSAAPAPAAQ
jgi:L,D-transpeptidase YcbB